MQKQLDRPPAVRDSAEGATCSDSRRVVTPEDMTEVCTSDSDCLAEPLILFISSCSQPTPHQLRADQSARDPFRRDAMSAQDVQL